MTNISELHIPLSTDSTVYSWLNVTMESTKDILVSTCDLRKKESLYPSEIALECSTGFIRDWKSATAELLRQKYYTRIYYIFNNSMSRNYNGLRIKYVRMAKEYSTVYYDLDGKDAIINNLAVFDATINNNRSFCLQVGAVMPADGLKKVATSLPCTAKLCDMLFHVVIGGGVMDILK